MIEINNTENNRNGRWQDLVNKCVTAFADISSSSYRTRKLEDIKQGHRIYNLIESPCIFPWKNAYSAVLPFLTITVDNLEPRMVASFVGKEPYVQFDMTGVQEPDEVSNFLENWFNNELKETVLIESNISKIVHSLLLEGTVYTVASYEEDTITREDFLYEGNLVKIDEEGNPLTCEVQDQVFQGCKISYSPFNDIYIPDSSDDWEKTDIIRIVRPTYAELQILEDEQEGYFNIGPWLLNEETEQDEQSATQEIDDVKFDGQEVIECYEYHVNYIYKEENENKDEIKDWTSERFVALITKETETLIRLIPLRSLNFQNEHLIKRIRYYPEAGKAYGCSLYEKLKSIQNGASDTFNLLMNCAYISIIPWYLYSAKTGLPDNMEIIPGQGIEVDDPSSVKFPAFNTNPNSFIPMFNIWTEQWERMGSIGDLQLGKPSSDAGTASEAMYAINEGNVKSNYQTTVMKSEFICLLKTIYDLYYKNMPLNSKFLYHGEEVLVPRKDMRRPLKFRLTGSTDLSNSVLELRKDEQLYATLRSDPLINPMELLTNLVASFKPDADPNKFVNPEIGQMIAQYMEQKKMQAEMEQKQKEEQMKGGNQGNDIQQLLQKIKGQQGQPQQGQQGPPQQGPPQGQQGPPQQGPQGPR